LTPIYLILTSIFITLHPSINGFHFHSPQLQLPRSLSYRFAPNQYLPQFYFVTYIPHALINHNKFIIKFFPSTPILFFMSICHQLGHGYYLLLYC
jgi:hypothetical protein